MDFFPTFQSFPETRNEKDAFTVDKRDIEEIQNKVSTNPIQKTKKSKHKRSKLNDTKIAGSTPIVQCDICSVPISGPIAYDSHFKGKKHQAQLAAVLVVRLYSIYLFTFMITHIQRIGSITAVMCQSEGKDDFRGTRTPTFCYQGRCSKLIELADTS